MSTTTITIIVILCVIALAILAGLTYFVVGPVLELLKRTKASSALLKKAKLLEELDFLIEEGETTAALEILPQIPILQAPLTIDVLSATREHNQSFLSRCLSLSDILGVGISNIEAIEHLVNEHAELSSLLFKVRFSFETIMGKREDQGKDLPQWTKNEFERKEAEVLKSLQESASKLQKETVKMIRFLKSNSNSRHMIH